MADSQRTDVPSAAHVSPHPMAGPGYGKRSTPGQAPCGRADFAHLPAREAAIACYIDRLPEGADISVKTLARMMPYGQCALRTALNVLQRTGHLRRGREALTGPGGTRWVTRTWFSRAARDDRWWASFAAGATPEERRSAAAMPTPPHPVPPPPTLPGDRSPAYQVLAALGRRDPAVSLSAADCEALEPLAAAWFARGAGPEDVLRALTEGLPVPVHHPAGLVGKRLVSKLPPQLPSVQAPVAVPRIIECGTCRGPARPEALVAGECGTCRGEPGRPREAAGLRPAAVHALAARTRAAAGLPVGTAPV